MSEVEELENAYMAASSDRERAALEARIWALVPPGRRDRRGIGAYFRDRFGEPCNRVSQRHALLNRGPAFDLLWVRVESGMAYTTAMRLAKSVASRSLDGGLPMDEVLASALAEYDADGFESRTADGRVFRKRRAPRSAPSGRASKREAAVGAKFRASVRKLITSYVESRAPGGDARLKARALSEFEVTLTVLISQFQQDVRGIPEALFRGGAGPSRRELLRACDVLGIPRPRPGQAVDMVRARAGYVARVKAYHTDLSGTEDTRAMFEETVAAMNVVKLSHSLLGSSRGATGDDERSQQCPVPQTDPGSQTVSS